MKIRTCFVSNSSSSSFIIAVGEIIDEIGLRTYLKDIGIQKYQYEFCSVKDFENNSELNHSTFDGKNINVESFNGDNVSIKIEDGKKYLALCSCYDCETTDDGDIIETDPEYAAKLSALRNEHGIIKNFNMSVGWGRNG